MMSIVGLLALTACSTTPAEQRWSKWFPGPQNSPDLPPSSGAQPLKSCPKEFDLVVTSDATPSDVTTLTKSNGGLSLKDLSDRGQSSLVDSVEKLIASENLACASTAKKGQPPCRHTVFLGALGISPSDNQHEDKIPPLGIKEATLFKRTIIINVSNSICLPPGDRLQQFTVEVKPSSPLFQFTDLKVAQTRSTDSKLGTITQQKKINITGNIDPALSGTIKGSAGFSNQKAVESDITEAIVPLNAYLQDGNLYIQRKGNAKTDITGDTVIEVTMTVPVDMTVPLENSNAALMVRQQNLFKKGKFLPSKSAILGVDLTRFPSDKEPVTATVTLDYLLRHVRWGASTYTEGDDSVTLFRRREVTQKNILIPNDEIIGEKWSVIARYGTSNKSSCEELKATPSWFAPDESFPLYFSDEVSARDFATWLMDTHATTINADQLTFKINQSEINWTKSPTFVVTRHATWRDSQKTTPFCQFPLMSAQ
jgi:hypothetical protein